jgi:hypothetical protein
VGAVIWGGDGETARGKGVVEESGELLVFLGSTLGWGGCLLTCFCVIDGFRGYGAGVY